MSNSLDQYLALYDAGADMIDAGSAPLMNAARRRAADALRAGLRLPEKGDEDYEKTSVNAMFAPDFGLNLARIDVPASPAESFRCGVPRLSTRLAVVANDTFHAPENLDAQLPEGVTFCSLREAATRWPDLVGRFYATVAPADNAAAALNTLLAQDGVFVRIAAGVRPERPLQLVNLFNAVEPLMAVRRMLIVAEPDSECRLLVCDHNGPSGMAQCLSSQVVEVVAMERSAVELYDLEEASESTSRMSQTFVRQLEGSRVQIHTIALSGGTTRNELNIDITGAGCETLLAGIAVGRGKRHIDNASTVRHLAPRSSSRQLFKYALDDESTGAFEGGILVTPAAPLTEAYQSNRNVLASARSRMHSKPRLEIYNDDVKCSHGATTGQLDAEALFYMQTRGIPRDQARIMLMQAFMTDVLDTVTLPGLRDRLAHLVEMRLNRCDSTCRMAPGECSQPISDPS